MRPKRLVPPPERATWSDAYRFLLGVLMIPLGIAILVRCVSAGIYTPAAFLLSLLLVAFGTYRVYVGVVRYRLLRSQSAKGQKTR